MVPYVKPIATPEDTPTELSNKLSTLLSQRGVSEDTKHRAYSNDLSKLNSFLDRGPSQSQQLLDTNKGTLASVSALLDLLSKPKPPADPDENQPPVQKSPEPRELNIQQGVASGQLEQNAIAEYKRNFEREYAKQTQEFNKITADLARLKAKGAEKDDITRLHQTYKDEVRKIKQDYEAGIIQRAQEQVREIKNGLTEM